MYCRSANSADGRRGDYRFFEMYFLTAGKVLRFYISVMKFRKI